MLKMQKGILPLPNQLPGSYEAALRVIEPYIVSPVTYDICINDCILFRNEFKSMPKMWVRSESGEAFHISPSKATFREALRKQFYGPYIAESLVC